jgi:hypothetical protein
MLSPGQHVIGLVPPGEYRLKLVQCSAGLVGLEPETPAVVSAGSVTTVAIPVHTWTY